MIRAALVQFEPRTLDAKLNFRRMADAIAAEGEAADLIVFPELSNTGYVEPISTDGRHPADASVFGPALWKASADLHGEELQQMAALAKQYQTHLVLGLAVRDPALDGVMRNASVLIGPEGLKGVYVKVHQWQNEKLFFLRGDQINTWPGPGCRLGMQICYDIRFPELTRIMATQGAQVITNIWAASNPVDAPLEDDGLFIHRIYTRAVENGVFMLSCNRVGVQAGYRFLGRSCAIAPNGSILGALDHDREDVLRVEINLEEITKYRALTGIWTDRDPALYARYLSAGLPSF